MGIEKYVSRAGFNEGVRKAGNWVYDGLGDGLVKDVSLKGVGKKVICGGIGLVAIAGVDAVNPDVAKGGSLGESLIKTFLYQGARSAAEKEFGPEKETTINIYENEQNGFNPLNPYLVESDEQAYTNPAIAIRRWKDFNRNGKRENNELLGKIKSSINLGNMGMHIQIEDNNNNCDVTFYILNSKDDIVLSQSNDGPAALYPAGCLDSGNYTIIAKRRDMTIAREFEVK